MNTFDNFPLGPTWYVLEEDFSDEYALTSSLPVAASSPWVGTAASSGTFSQATDEKFGVAVLSGAATTDNSGVQIQGDMETLSVTAGKELQFSVKCKASDGTQDEYFAGISITDTTILDGTGTLAAGITATDCIGFYKPDGGTQIYGVVRRDSVQIATGAYTFDPTAYHELSFQVNPNASDAGIATVSFFLNGIYIGQLSTTTAPKESEEILTRSIAFLTGDASGTKTLTVDYVNARQKR